ncbi:MAG: glycosyltransferase, partial [Planctomycetia bacterium]|nr:glycosyltransferase [Planctomycetia bacterium]
PTRNRPEAFDLLQRWMAAQTYGQPYQWVVVNDGPAPYHYRMNQDIFLRTPAEGEGPSQHQNLLHALPHVRGDKVLIIEDDDYYRPDYLNVMAGMLDHYPLVGEGRAVYYNVRTRRYVTWSNLQHASLAQTGLRAEVIPTLTEGCRQGSRYIDLYLWDNFRGLKHVFAGKRLQVGIKGMPGENGFGICHGDEGTPDEDLQRFRAWNLPGVYEGYYRPDRPEGTSDGRAGGRDLIAPLGAAEGPSRFRGRCTRKPWEYRVTAVIPHLNTPGPLRWAVETLRHQSETPYILVIDTGSDEAACGALEGLRDEGLEIHYLKGHAWTHTAEPVAAAMDTAFALCQTEYLYCTHADCFVRRRDWLAWLASCCGERDPVVGYQMSDRSDLTPDWEWMVSHTATMLHMPTMRRAGVSWSFPKYRALRAAFRPDNPHWIDTETGFNWSLRRAGVVPVLLGPEVNFDRQTDGNIDHVRSYPSATLYTVGSAAYRENKEQWMETAIDEARERVRAWSLTPVQ